MRRRDVMWGGGAVTVAVIAIGGGVLVSSGAMAASSDEPAATVSMITIGSDGTAIQCQIDADLLPAIPVLADGAGTLATQSATAEANADGTVTWSTGSLPPGAPLPPLPPTAGGLPDPGPVLSVHPGGAPAPGVETEGGVVVATAEAAGAPGEGHGAVVVGSSTADGESHMYSVAPDGTQTELEVRDGTPEECAAAQRPPTDGVTTSDGD